MASRTVPARKTSDAKRDRAIVDDIRSLIAEAQAHAAVTVNATMTLLYWRVGHRARTAALGSVRAGYGAQIVVTVSRELVADHVKNPHAKAGLEHVDPKDLVASMRTHEEAEMRLPGEIEALVAEVAP